MRLTKLQPNVNPARGFTLVELLITVAVLGIAGALVVPAMSQTGDLRVQAGVRSIISDIAFAQADAMAYQTRRAIVFGQVSKKGANNVYSFVPGNGYTVAEVTGASLDLSVNAMADPTEGGAPISRNLDDPRFGGASITSVNINGSSTLIFDELGGPVASLTGDSGPVGGTIDVSSPVPAPGVTYRITIAPMTGRITVARIANAGSSD